MMQHAASGPLRAGDAGVAAVRHGPPSSGWELIAPREIGLIGGTAVAGLASALVAVARIGLGGPLDPALRRSGSARLLRRPCRGRLRAAVQDRGDPRGACRGPDVLRLRPPVPQSRRVLRPPDLRYDGGVPALLGVRPADDLSFGRILEHHLLRSLELPEVPASFDGSRSQVLPLRGGVGRRDALRDDADLRSHRHDQPLRGPRARRAGARRPARRRRGAGGRQRESSAPGDRPGDRRLRVQDRDGPVSPVGAGRLRGLADPDYRLASP